MPEQRILLIEDEPTTREVVTYVTLCLAEGRVPGRLCRQRGCGAYLPSISALCAGYADWRLPRSRRHLSRRLRRKLGGANTDYHRPSLGPAAWDRGASPSLGKGNQSDRARRHRQEHNWAIACRLSAVQLRERTEAKRARFGHAQAAAGAGREPAQRSFLDLIPASL